MITKIDYKKYTERVWKLIFTQGLLMIINFLLSILTTRWLGPVGKGEQSIAATVYSLGVQVGVLGLHSAHTYYLSRDKNNLSYVLGNSIFVSLVAGIIFGILAFIIKYIMPSCLPIDNLLLLLSSIMTPVQLLYTFQINALIAINETKLRNFLDILNVILCIGLVIIVQCINGLSPIKLLLINIGTAMLLLEISYIFIRIKHRSVPHFSFSFLRKVLPYGLAIQVSCVIAYLLLRVDVLMIGHMLGSEQTGIYSLGVNLADLLTIVSTSISTLLFPVASACENNSERIDFVNKNCKSLFKILVICSVLMAIVAPIGIPLVYGKEYTASVPPFLILLPGVIFWGMVSVIANYFSAIKNFRYQFIAMGIALICNLVLNDLLIAKIGIEGAALASSISYITAFLILWYQFRKDKKACAKEIKSD